MLWSADKKPCGTRMECRQNSCQIHPIPTPTNARPRGLTPIQLASVASGAHKYPGSLMKTTVGALNWTQANQLESELMLLCTRNDVAG